MKLPKLFFWMGKPPSLRSLRVGNAICAAAMIGLAIISDEKWVVFVDAAIGGFNVGAVLYTSVQLRQHAAFNSLKDAFDAMCQINKDLIQSRVEFLVGKDEDDRPPAPMLH